MIPQVFDFFHIFKLSDPPKLIEIFNLQINKFAEEENSFN